MIKNNTPSRLGDEFPPRAFTLIELLVVIAIICDPGQRVTARR